MEALGVPLKRGRFFSDSDGDGAQRTREFGIRIALGSDGRRILGLVLREGLLLVGVGLGAGIIGAVLLRRLIVSQLYGVGAFDPAVLAGVTVVLAFVSLRGLSWPGAACHAGGSGHRAGPAVAGGSPHRSAVRIQTSDGAYSWYVPRKSLMRPSSKCHTRVPTSSIRS